MHLEKKSGRNLILMILGGIRNKGHEMGGGMRKTLILVKTTDFCTSAHNKSSPSPCNL